MKLWNISELTEGKDEKREESTALLSSLHICETLCFSSVKQWDSQFADCLVILIPFHRNKLFCPSYDSTQFATAQLYLFHCLVGNIILYIIIIICCFSSCFTLLTRFSAFFFSADRRSGSSRETLDSGLYFARCEPLLGSATWHSQQPDNSLCHPYKVIHSLSFYLILPYSLLMPFKLSSSPLSEMSKFPRRKRRRQRKVVYMYVCMYVYIRRICVHTTFFASETKEQNAPRLDAYLHDHCRCRSVPYQSK